MKPLFAIGAASIVFAATTGFRSTAVHDAPAMEGSRVEVVFTPELNVEDLVRIKGEVAAAAIALQYKQLGFDDDGRLVSISFSIDCGPVCAGAAATEKLSDEARFGFVVDRSGSGNVSFTVGRLDPPAGGDVPPGPGQH